MTKIRTKQLEKSNEMKVNLRTLFGSTLPPNLSQWSSKEGLFVLACDHFLLARTTCSLFHFSLKITPKWISCQIWLQVT